MYVNCKHLFITILIWDVMVGQSYVLGQRQKVQPVVQVRKCSNFDRVFHHAHTDLSGGGGGVGI